MGGGVPVMRRDGWDRPCVGQSIPLPSPALGLSPASFISVDLVTVRIPEMKLSSYPPPQHRLELFLLLLCCFSYSIIYNHGANALFWQTLLNVDV